MRADSLAQFDRKISSLMPVIDKLDWAGKMTANVTLTSAADRMKPQSGAAAMLSEMMQSVTPSAARGLESYGSVAKIGAAGLLGDVLSPKAKAGLYGLDVLSPKAKAGLYGLGAFDPQYKAGLIGGLDRKFGQAFADALGPSPAIKSAVDGLTGKGALGADLLGFGPKYSLADAAGQALRPEFSAAAEFARALNPKLTTAAADAAKAFMGGKHLMADAALGFDPKLTAASFGIGLKFGPDVMRTIEKLSPMMPAATLDKIADLHLQPYSAFDIGETGRLARQWSRPVATPLDPEQTQYESIEADPDVTDQRAWLRCFAGLSTSDLLALLSGYLGLILALSDGLLSPRTLWVLRVLDACMGAAAITISARQRRE